REWKLDLVEETVAELEAEDVACVGVVSDVKSRESIYSTVDQTLERFGRVDGLVNNAMTLPAPQALEHPTAHILDNSLVPGVQGTLWAMQAVYRHMKRTGWGRIVNVGSLSELDRVQWHGRVRRRQGGDPLVDPNRGARVGGRRDRGNLYRPLSVAS